MTETSTVEQPRPRLQQSPGDVKAIEDVWIKVEGFCDATGIALSPWYYSTSETCQVILEEHDRRVESIALIPRVTPSPNGMREWLRTFAASFLEPFPPVLHLYILWLAILRMEATLCAKDGDWHADDARVRVSVGQE